MPKIKQCMVLVVFTFCASICLAQTAYPRPSMTAKKIKSPITLDGKLDEAAWFTSTPAESYSQYFPTDSLKATKQTEIYLVYDDVNLYVGIKCYAQSDEYIVPSLKRDYRAGGSDNITLMFDTFDDGTNAIFFGVNPYGVLREGLISGGGAELSGFNESWDNKWTGETIKTDEYWVSELAIPFKILRYKDGCTKWQMNSYRFDSQTNEISVWGRIPRNQSLFSLAFSGEINFEEPLTKNGSNISLIPYAAGSMTQDFEADNTDPNFDYNIGGDAKLAVTSGLNLDLTFNPDFSQVEVDRQVTNLDRFEIFFPERRQFFIENADLFSSFGSSRINPFFSRRIGVATDTLTEDIVQNTIYAGARLSGKIGNDWRVGLLNMQTAPDESFGLPSYNYTVAAVQRKLFARSNVGFIFVNKQNFQEDKGAQNFDTYNRVLGVDYNLASEDNRWTGKVFYHQAITQDDSVDDKFGHGVEINYKERNYSVEWNHRWVGEGFDAQVGFVPRKNYFRISPEVQWFFYPKKGSIFNQNGPGAEFTVFFSPEYGKTDHQFEFYWRGSLSNNTRFRATIRNNYTYLTDAFDPTGTDAEQLSADTEYTYTNFSASYGSDRRKKFSFRIEPTVGQYFNGFRYGVGGSFSYRFQPFGSIAINYNYNHIDLPEPYATTDLFLIGPRIDITFTKKIFLTTFFQYNNQIDNFNINARFQWRFAPVSDFFLVYTDNYYASDFGVKNRAIVAKFTYWLNL